jgi:pentatricopeptide repeat protein
VSFQMRALLAAACAAALAATPSASAEPSSAPAAVTTDRDKPDDLALRYYAALDQRARVRAEFSRLRRLYPNFEPPADLYGPRRGDVDETGLWELFAADKIDELREAIALRQKDMPGWRPSEDLTQKMRHKESRNTIFSLWREGRWLDIAAFARDSRFFVANADAESLWTIAEAFARTGQIDDALDVYRSMLASGGDSHIRLATMQKALANLQMSHVEALLAEARKTSKGSEDEFAAVANDLMRARIVAVLRDERKDDIADDELRRFEAYAERAQDPREIGLVAWLRYRRRDFPAALESFKAAVARGGDAMIAHGLAHTLRALDMRREAEEVSYAWRRPLVNNAILFLDLLERDLTLEIPPYVEPSRLARYASVAIETASGEGAQGLGWYAYNSCQFDVAQFWFERAVAWLPKEATVYGYVLTLRRLRKHRQALELVNRYDGLFPKVVELLFPDDYYHPPFPCDARAAARAHGPAVKMAGYVVPGPASADFEKLRVVVEKKEATTPDAARLEAQNRERVLKAARGKFPIAVTAENPLRFPPLPQTAAGRAAPSLEKPVGLRPEPLGGRAPLVARRVPGVGPMPSERYGFLLSPGWNGVDLPSWPPASEQAAPAGTQWGDAEADPAWTGQQKAAAERRSGGDVERTAAGMAPRTRYGGAPPAPGASIALSPPADPKLGGSH